MNTNLTRVPLLAALAALVLVPAVKAQEMPTPTVAFGMLTEGNHRHAGHAHLHPHLDAAARAAGTEGQSPFAVVLACVDSRVPPELVFDRGIGDLLVIRTAGHALDAAALGSIEYGIGVLQSPLLYVLGHENCGAVDATMKTLESEATAPGSIHALVEHIAPAVVAAADEPGDPLAEAVEANVELTVEKLLSASEMIREAVEAGRSQIVGGVYDLDTGEVEVVTQRAASLGSE